MMYVQCLVKHMVIYLWVILNIELLCMSLKVWVLHTIMSAKYLIFVSASHQTELDTKAMTWWSIIVEI